MTRSPIRLIALDVDGTLVDHNFKFSPRVKSAIAQAQQRGIAVTLATGRSPRAARPFAEELEINVPLICFQGGLIAERDGHVLHRITLDRGLAAQIIAFAQSRNWHASLYQGGQFYLTELRLPIAFYQGLLDPQVHLVPDLSSVLDDEPDKILMIAEGNSEEIEAELRRQFGDRAQIVRSHEMFIEAVPLGVDKGQGLAWLAGRLGVPRSQVMAIGDQDNDAPMVAWAGLGVAMGNASAACRAVADWIAPPVAADGAAVAIEQFVLVTVQAERS